MHQVLELILAELKILVGFSELHEVEGGDALGEVALVDVLRQVLRVADAQSLGLYM